MGVRPGVWPADAENDSVEQALALIDQRRWWDAYQVLSRLDARSGLAAQGLEQLAVAAFLCGRRKESRHARLRAYQIHLGAGESRRAALCAMRIGLGQISIGELAQATGCLPATLTSCGAWVGQASTLLEGEEEGVEHGYLLLPVAYERLASQGDLAAAAVDSARAVEMARRFDDPDLLVLGLNIQGRIMTRSGRVEEGMVPLDEAVMTVVNGEVSPSIAGIVLSSAVEAAVEVLDLRRFGEWVESLETWCRSQQGIVSFRTRSLGHAAMLLQLRGRWDAALETAARACDGPTADTDAEAPGIAHYRRGELLRLRGDLPEAEAAYREASRLGLDPQPGLALLRLAEGDSGAAVMSIGRAADETKDRLERAKLLPALVEILTAAGDLSAASEAAGELERIAGEYPTPILNATAEHARGLVHLAEGDSPAALERLRTALRVWLHFGLSYEVARSRLLIARCCRLLGDSDTAALELDGARRTFSRLGARPDLAQADSLLDEESSTHGLTRRELEVLRLLTTGLTNKSIAGELTVSVRTVDSHVSSILTKLGLSTRAAATSFAYRHDLV